MLSYRKETALQSAIVSRKAEDWNLEEEEEEFIKPQHKNITLTRLRQ